MFKEGDLIVYGNNGIYEVADIGKNVVEGVKEGKQYYTLRQYYENGDIVFTPVDNSKILMRRILSKKEIEDFIDLIPSIEARRWENSSKRDEFYKESFRTCDLIEYIRLLKLLYGRRER